MDNIRIKVSSAVLLGGRHHQGENTRVAIMCLVPSSTILDCDVHLGTFTYCFALIGHV